MNPRPPLKPGLDPRDRRGLRVVARGGVVDEVPEVTHDPAPGEHPVRGHDHVRPRRHLDGRRLVAEVVTPAATELEIGTGSIVYAAVKASAFRERGG